MRGAVVFDLGSLDIYPAVDFAKFGFVGLPYGKIWVEADAKENATFRIGAYVTREKHQTAEAENHQWLVFVQFKGNIHWVFHNMFVTSQKDGIIKGNGPLEDDEITAEQYMAWVANIYGAFLAARCKNVEAIENTPSKLKQERAKKKCKVPIFSDWTLHIKLGDKQKCEHGGTHSYPRAHLRRGHVREYKPGLFTWVQECVVGSRSGIVHKDYAVHA